MASKRGQDTLKENGHVVMDALNNIDRLPTLVNLTKYISTKHRTNPDKVKEPLKKVLESGIALGLFTRQKGKYYVYGQEEENEEGEEMPGNNELMDATRRRKRSRKSSATMSRKSRSRKRSTSTKSSGKMRSQSRSRRRRKASSEE